MYHPSRCSRSAGHTGDAPYSRFLEESSQAAAHQQEELLAEEDPGDLLQGGLGLTPQVQDGWSQEGDAETEAEKHAPVGESLLPVALEQRPDPLVQCLHAAPSHELLHTAAALSRRTMKPANG